MSQPSLQLKYLNLGCGRRFHPAWTNLDLIPSDPSVRAHNVLQGVPYPDEFFEVVYHSHVLEHLPHAAAPAFLKECHRVLCPGGILRVVVPDLENIVRNYLEALESARQGKPGSEANYEWMLLELYDQAVREQSGGGWKNYLGKAQIPNWEFIEKRVGAEAREFRDELRAQANSTADQVSALRAKLPVVLTNLPRVLKDKMAKALISDADEKAAQLGHFRRGGEIHQWMYDSYSLARLLREVGFSEPRQAAATESVIPDWPWFHLDNETDGSTYKPDSLFMEARKPRRSD